MKCPTSLLKKFFSKRLKAGRKEKERRSQMNQALLMKRLKKKEE
jgi:hypothetical protein